MPPDRSGFPSDALLAFSSPFFLTPLPLPALVSRELNPPCREAQCWSGPTFKTKARPNLGLRYQPVPRSDDPPNLPPAARTRCAAGRRTHQHLDRGSVRDKNDRTLDSRALEFQQWLVKAAGIDNQFIPRLNPGACFELIGTFLQELRQIPLPSKKASHMTSTLAGFMRLAQSYLQYRTGRLILLQVAASSKSSKKLDPYIGDAIGDTQKWQQPKPKIEPFTWKMFAFFHKQVTAEGKRNHTSYLDKPAAVYDWGRFGNFTGSCCGEYAQSHQPRGTYARVSNDPAAGANRGLPLTFIASYLVFYSALMIKLPHDDALLLKQIEVHELHVTFQYDKSPRNFSVRKFQKGISFLCPIDAAISILFQAPILEVPANKPIGVFCTDTAGHYTYLTGNDIKNTMQSITKQTYPDPHHFLHAHVTRIVSHSNRVTAAVALKNAGLAPAQIAFRLRWTEESVVHYLRESSNDIGALTLQAIQAATVL